MLRADFQRIFSSLRFWAAAAGVFLAMGIAAYLQFTGELGYTLELAASGLPPGFHQEVLLAALRTPWLRALLDQMRAERCYSAYYLPCRWRSTRLVYALAEAKRTGSPLYGKLDWAGYYLLLGRLSRS